MKTTQVQLGGLMPNDCKLSAPIFSQPNNSLPVSLSVSTVGEHVRNIQLTVVYWEDGQKKIIKDYVAGYGATPIEFSINNPTSVPPYILYIESTGIGGVTVSIDADYPLNVGPLNEYDERLLSAEDTSLPQLQYCDFSKFMNMDGGYTPMPVPTKELKQCVNTALKYSSPLIVDLDGDGVETLGTNSGVYFDHDNNEFAERTGWVGRDDGLLVRDINGNGQIDNGTELFGDNSVLSSGQKAINGFEALKELDSNNDGFFSGSDTAWNEVKVWKDANSNGSLDAGELLTLEQAGIAAVNLNYYNSSEVDDNNNQHGQTGTFIKTDGTTGMIHDVYFDDDKADTRYKSDIVIPEDIKALPNIAGSGNVHSLHAAMALDETGELKALVEQYMNETNVENLDALIVDIIYHWTGVQDIAPDSRKPSYFYHNPIGDARKLEALERFTGQKFFNKWWFGQREPNPHEQAAAFLLSGFDMLADFVKSSLEMSGSLKPYLDKIILTWDNTAQVWNVDVSGAVADLRTLSQTDWGRFLYVLHNIEKSIQFNGLYVDTINSAFQNAAEAETSDIKSYLQNFGRIENLITSGSDIIYGTEDNNVINALAGDDRVFGYGGDDTLNGGSGNDYLVGGSGSDTYVFEGSWGNDCIDNFSDDAKGEHPDTVWFKDVLPADATILRQGNDLILTFHDGADSVKIYSYFLDQGATTQTVDVIKFADGTIWDYSYIRDRWNSNPQYVDGGYTLEGGSGSDVLYGSNGSDFLMGNDGDDVLYGYGGNDVLIGGKGNDRLDGGDGNDVYIWNLGDGYDTVSDLGNDDKIIFGEGIAFEDLTFTYMKNGHLRIIVKNDLSQGVEIQNFFNGQIYQVENLQFADGSIRPLNDVGLELVQEIDSETVYGTDNSDIIDGAEGNDTIYGKKGDDIIIGGKGNDILYGEQGDDTYIWRLGDGLDTIDDMYGNSNIRFGDNISESDLTYERLNGNSYDLFIYVKGDRTQGVIIKNYFQSANNQNFTLNFTTGASKNLYQTSLVLTQTDRDDNISVSDIGHTIDGGAGNDTITGGKGNDVIIGGKGHDIINGGWGDDTYIYNLGDGFDSIEDNSGNNKIKFGAGIAYADITFGRDESYYDLYMFINGDKTQGICLKDFYRSPNYRNMVLFFVDGTNVNLALENLTTVAHNSFNLWGTTEDQVLTGGDNNDTINGNGGNNTIIGGKGNDSLTGGSGNDTFIYNLGDGFDTIWDYGGNDTIRFGAGIGFDDLRFVKAESGLKIIVNNDLSQGVYIQNFYNSSYKIEKLEFADNTVVSLETLNPILQQTDTDDNVSGTTGNDTIYGGAGNDTITTAAGDDILIGGPGNDYLDGGDGNDTYVYNLGDGVDTIYDSYGSNDKLLFGDGITISDLNFMADGYDLRIRVGEDENNTIYIKNHMNNSNYRVETIEFADGSTLDISNANQLIQAMSSFNAAEGATASLSANGVDNVAEMYNLAANPDLQKQAA